MCPFEQLFFCNVLAQSGETQNLQLVPYWLGRRSPLFPTSSSWFSSWIRLNVCLFPNDLTPVIDSIVFAVTRLPPGFPDCLVSSGNRLLMDSWIILMVYEAGSSFVEVCPSALC